MSRVSKAYGTTRFMRNVVKDCSFTIERSKLTVMIGPSGCGKSALIRLLAGFERPNEGSISIDGKPVNGPDRNRLVVFQETALFPWMTAYENIMHGPKARGEVDAKIRNLAEFLLDKVGLTAFRSKYPSQLSGACSAGRNWLVP